MVLLGQISPIIRLPISDAFEGGAFMVPLRDREYDFCSSFRLRFYECMEAYGRNLAYVKCKDFFTDLHECTFSVKQFQRAIIMKQERERQFKAGERKEKYSKPPEVDSY